MGSEQSIASRLDSKTKQPRKCQNAIRNPAMKQNGAAGALPIDDSVELNAIRKLAMQRTTDAEDFIEFFNRFRFYENVGRPIKFRLRILILRYPFNTFFFWTLLIRCYSEH